MSTLIRNSCRSSFAGLKFRDQAARPRRQRNNLLFQFNNRQWAASYRPATASQEAAGLQKVLLIMVWSVWRRNPEGFLPRTKSRCSGSGNAVLRVTSYLVAWDCFPIYTAVPLRHELWLICRNRLGMCNELTSENYLEECHLNVNSSTDPSRDG